MPSPIGKIQEDFAKALDDLLSQIKLDRSILAAILCGSLSHDVVWAKSDIDLALITIDDKKTERSSISLNAEGVNVHAFLLPRAEFRTTVEGAVRNSFFHSLLAKGRLLYTHDETIAQLFAGINDIGGRDREAQLLASAAVALGSIYKARKWLITRGDLDYTALWILYAAAPLARIEVIHAGLLVDREVIQQAIKLNPAFFKIVYSDMLNSKKTIRAVTAALEAADHYLAEREPILFRLVFDHLREVGEARSCTEIESHFKRNFNIEGVITVCEYLADRGLLGKISTAVQLTRTSNVQVQELGFVYLGDPQSDF